MAVQSSAQMQQFVRHIPAPLLDILEQLFDRILAEHPPEQTEDLRARLNDLRAIRRGGA
jgi:hypothetical protein